VVVVWDRELFVVVRVESLASAVVASAKGVVG
jgi:hypothetical protein